MHKYERTTAAAIIALAAIVMADSYRKSGWTASGPDSGWYPFWSAAIMGIAGAVIFARSWTVPPLPGAMFSSRAGVIALGTLLAPMVALVALLGQFGLYVTSGAYMGLFAAAVGHYRWYHVILLGIGVPATLYLMFELGFRFSLPKSLFYARGLLPF